MAEIFVFIVGLCVGSFINVLIFRLGKKGGAWLGRSECPKCLRALKWFELIPILSFLLLKGKCKGCKGKISPIYPTVEILAGLIFLSYFYFNGLNNLGGVYYLFMILILISLIFFDYIYFIIPNKIIYPTISVALIYNIFQPLFWMNFLTALILSGGFAIMYLGSGGRWVGLGDAKLIFLTSMILGYPLAVLSLLSAVWIAAIWGVWLIILKKATLKTALPFGSFLASLSILFIIFKNELQEIVKIFI